MLGKGWRVEHYKVVMIFSRLQEPECIFAKGFVTRVVREIQGNIAIGQIYGLGTTVNRVHKLCPTPHGIERESPSIAEHIEHIASLSILLQERTVLTLVNKKACFLTTQPIDVEFQSILYGDVFGTSPVEEAVLWLHIWKRGLTFIEDILYALPHHVHQLSCNLLPAQMHSYAMSLHNSSLPIYINNKPRQMVTLTMHQSIGIISR